MRLINIQKCLKAKGIDFKYTENDDCGGIDFIYKGLRYHVWEYPEPERGAESNVRGKGRSEEFNEGYEEEILAIIEERF